MKRSLLVLLLVVWVVIIVSIPKLNVDRYQEGAYLGTPYFLMQCNTFRVMSQDPFPQNGALIVAIPAWIYLKTGSLLALRVYFSLFSIAALLLSHFLLKRCLSTDKLSQTYWALLHATMAMAWASIPILLEYSVQTNGYMAALCAVLGGLILLPEKKPWAYFLFGLGAHFKGQFLGLSFGFILYIIVATFLEHGIRRIPWELMRFFVFFFAAPFVMTTLIYLPLGWIQSMEWYLKSSFSTSITLYEEVSSLILRVLNIGTSIPQEMKDAIRERRRDEFSHFISRNYFHIVTSFLFCCSGVVAMILRKGAFQKSPLIPVCFAGVIYWINYLFFYSYPYWYNTLAILWFSILFFPLLIHAVLKWFPIPQKVAAFCLVVSAVLPFLFIKKYTPALRRNLGPGTSLQDYTWKLNPAKCDS